MTPGNPCALCCCVVVLVVEGIEATEDADFLLRCRLLFRFLFCVVAFGWCVDWACWRIGVKSGEEEDVVLCLADDISMLMLCTKKTFLLLLVAWPVLEETDDLRSKLVPGSTELQDYRTTGRTIY